MNDRFRIMQRQPQRISVTLNFGVHQALLKRSEEEGRSMSNLCAFLLEESLLPHSPIPAAASRQPPLFSHAGRPSRTSSNGVGVSH